MLQDLVGNEVKVWQQPPGKEKLTYPCVICVIDDERPEFADNMPVRITERYQVTVIDPSSDSDVRRKVRGLPMCRFDRHFRADNLNHFVYNLFF